MADYILFINAYRNNDNNMYHYLINIIKPHNHMEFISIDVLANLTPKQIFIVFKAIIYYTDNQAKEYNALTESFHDSSYFLVNQSTSVGAGACTRDRESPPFKKLRV